MNTENKTDFSKIDAVLKQATDRKNKRAGITGSATAPGEMSPRVAPANKRPRLSDQEKAQRLAEKEADRIARKAARIHERDAKRAEKNANKPAAHLAKVEKAANRLPVLNDLAQVTVNDITTNFSRDQINAISAHLSHFNRLQATKRALEQRLEKGMQVRIVGGDSRYVGQVGEVFKAQRIRCYVTVEGAKKPIYLFTSEVELVAAASATGTND